MSPSNKEKMWRDVDQLIDEHLSSTPIPASKFARGLVLVLLCGAIVFSLIAEPLIGFWKGCGHGVDCVRGIYRYMKRIWNYRS